MTTPRTVLRGVIEALKASSEYSGGSYEPEELDFDGEHNRMEQPIIGFQIVDNVRAVEWDSDLAEYITDQSGARTGRRFEATWEMAFDVMVYISAANPDYDIEELGFDLQMAMLQYDGKQQNDPLPDPDSTGDLSDVKSFTVHDGVPEPDLAGPGLRRWRQSFETTFVAVRTTSDPTITTITVPHTKGVEEDSTEGPALVWLTS